MVGANFSSWYRADEGSFSVTAATTLVVGVAALTTANSINSNGFVHSIGVTNGFWGARAIIGSEVAGFSLKANVPNAFETVAYAYRINDFAATVSGSAVATDTSGALPPDQVRLNIGSYAATPLTLNGTIKKLSYYPKRLSNTELVALTS
jgi:hypothetical protein